MFDWLGAIIGGTTKSLLLDATDSNGNSVSYSYDPLTDALLSTTGDGTNTDISYDYTDYALQTIERNDTTYGYAYDSLGRVTAATVGGQVLSSTSYKSNSQLSSTTYANGDTFAPTANFMSAAGTRPVVKSCSVFIPISPFKNKKQKAALNVRPSAFF